MLCMAVLGVNKSWSCLRIGCCICARAQLISQRVDARQLNVPPQQQPITLSLTRAMLN